MRWLPFLAPVAPWGGRGLPMEHKIDDSHLTWADSSKFVTFNEAEDLGGFELARQ